WADSFVEEVNLSRNIFLLRKTFGNGEKFIETIPRRGYRFIAPVTETVEDAGFELVAREKTLSRIVVEEEIETLDEGRQEGRQKAKGKRQKFVAGFYLAAFGLCLLAAVGAAYLISEKFLRSAKSAGPPPFESFRLKRYTDNGSFNRAVISADGK